MYFCNNCKREFENYKTVTEKHGLSTPPYEKLSVCPFCLSGDIAEKTATHCRYCGAKLKSEATLYCSEKCRKLNEILWKRQMLRKNAKLENSLFSLVNEIDAYNKRNGTRLSYGQYVALKNQKKLNLRRRKNV